MSELTKVRVQLLDAKTGEVLEDVDVKTSPGAVLFPDGKDLIQKLSDIELTPGPVGATGPTGQRGSRWMHGTAITGTSATAAVFSTSGITDALANDCYLNTTTGNTYRCTVSGAAAVAKWVYTGNIKGVKGDTGEKGATGAAGSTGATGTSMRMKNAWAANTVYVNNAQYIDVVTQGGNTYACKTGHTSSAAFDTSKWTLIAQKGAVGATGAQGPKGDTGATGAKGATGATGPAGKDGDSVKFGTNYASATDIKIFLKRD